MNCEERILVQENEVFTLHVTLHEMVPVVIESKPPSGRAAKQKHIYIYKGSHVVYEGALLIMKFLRLLASSKRKAVGEKVQKCYVLYQYVPFILIYVYLIPQKSKRK